MAAATQTLQKPPAVAPVLKTVNDLLEKFKGNIAVALPKHMTPERMIRVALTAVSQSERLQKCNPYTICGAIVQASILGLEPNSALGDCYLVPFWNKKANGGRGGYEAQVIVGYSGKVKLVANTGELQGVVAKPVRQNDEFEFSDGLDPFVRHRYHHIANRGPIIGFWAGAKMKGGFTQIVYMTVKEVEEHRDRFALSRKKDSNEVYGPWVDHFEAMALKTVIHKVCKYLPKSVQAQTAWQLDEQAEAGLPQKFSIEVPFELQPTSDDDDDPRRIEGSTVITPQRQSEQTEQAQQQSQQPQTETTAAVPTAAPGEQGSLLPDQAKAAVDPDDKRKRK